MTPPEVPNLPPGAAAVKVTTTEVRGHAQSVAIAILSTAILVGGFWYLHVRVELEKIRLEHGVTENSFPSAHDVWMFGLILLVAILIGYWKRLPMLSQSVAKVIRARKGGPDE